MIAERPVFWGWGWYFAQDEKITYLIIHCVPMPTYLGSQVYCTTTYKFGYYEYSMKSMVSSYPRGLV